MANVPGVWLLLSFAMHLAGAAACGVAMVWVLKRGDRERIDRAPLLGALAATAGWCVVHAALGPTAALTAAVEIGRNLTWIYLIFRLFANDGRHQSMRPIRPVVYALCFVELLQLVLLAIAASYALTADLQLLVLQVMAMFRVLVAVGSLVLLHNLYVGAAQPVRQVLRWTTAALAALWAFDLNVYTVAYLGQTYPYELFAMRGLVIALAAIPLAIGATSGAASMRLRPSRTVAFQTLSLIVIGAYLVLMIGIAQSLTLLGGNVGRLAQVGFTFAASVVAILWLPSPRLRGWLRVTAVKHLFQHRYDYRSEWLRFTQTIGRSDDADQSLQERAIKAMADITDSPSGLLFLRDDQGALELAARWRWKDIEVPAGSMARGLAKLLEDRTFIIDADDVRAGRDQHGETALVPPWLLEDTKAWALVPLLHFDRLTGVIVLARPPEPRNLDWEDFDLLRVVGQQLASYLAEQSGQQALMEAARFDEFNRRIAFVMHDVKNLASQLSLLSRNAERHADNPAFRADMLVTLRKSAEKLNALIARLNRYGTSGSDQRALVQLVDIAERTAARFAGVHKVSVINGDTAMILADAENLEQALVHLVQNSVDASPADSPVYLNVSADAQIARIELIDSGQGMSPEFIRNGLFTPFVSSKANGFGIGAFEARELIRAMGGNLDVDSREGLGTRFAITFPIPEPDSVASEAASRPEKVA
jgi:putative PEP-CTERM system histidine kinase